MSCYKISLPLSAVFKSHVKALDTEFFLSYLAQVVLKQNFLYTWITANTFFVGVHTSTSDSSRIADSGFESHSSRKIFVYLFVCLRFCFQNVLLL